MEQSPLCYAALKYIHSLIGEREEKRWKKSEGNYFSDFSHHFPVCTLLFPSEQLENLDSPLAIRPHAVWIASRKYLSGCCSGQPCCQGA